MLIIQPSPAKYAYQPFRENTHDREIADLVDPVRMIALRPITIVGPLAFYWSLGKKSRFARTCGDWIVMTLRVRWIGHAARTLIRSIHNPKEPR
jgi:hypothetical protein